MNLGFLRLSDTLAKRRWTSANVVIPDAGHPANLDQPRAFNRAVADFLSTFPG
jgi:pimeloyl-ACP methyl ester carboxylesterase